MDSSGSLSDLNLSELQQYLGDTNFPAAKQEVGSTAESNGAPQAVVARIRNSSIERFEALEEVLQAVRRRSKRFPANFALSEF
jgi:hypothetical protein